VLQGEQDAAPAEEVNFPTAHAEQTELSAIEILPAVHGVQIVAPVVFENVPAEQIVQVEALVFTYLPTSQSEHSAGRVVQVLARALQGKHDVAPAAGENFPPIHDEQTERPAVEYLPVVHGMQMVTLVAPVVFEKVPGAQYVQVEANELE